MYQGSGPIDGPMEVGSSTRSELGGFTAPLLLTTAIANFWGIRHQCKFRWYTDSTTAIRKVRLYTGKGKSQKYPEHSDYMTTITYLISELKCPINPCWVKGHQDVDCPYDELPREARLNVDVDQLATDHFKVLAQHPPRRCTEHIQCQKLSLTINGKRYPANWDSNLRWAINGSYMKEYLATKHAWRSETVWGTIDFTMVRAYMNHKKDL